LQIELQLITKRFGPGVAALKQMDLSIGHGERVAVLGPSGSGKTTLLRLIAGLETPDSGSIRIGERDMAGIPPHHRQVAMVFQNPALYPHLSVRENLVFGLRARGVPRPSRRERAAELAASLGLEHLLDRRPGSLSGGERQRVALGRALAVEPGVLLLDEPFSSLDEPLRAELRAQLIEIHRRTSVTIIHVTHDQEEALALGQRVAVLRQGCLMQFDRPEAIHDRPAHRFVASFVGSPGMNLIDCELQSGNGTLEVRPLIEGSFSPFPAPEALAALRFAGKPRDRLVLGFRPEQVLIPEAGHRPSGPGPILTFPVRIAAMEFKGHSILVALRLGSQVLHSRIRPEPALSRDQLVHAEIDLSRASWFDPETSLRLKPDCQPPADAIA
jgi:ABC-type sugar transport system ATPase subunit